MWQRGAVGGVVALAAVLLVGCVAADTGEDQGTADPTDPPVTAPADSATGTAESASPMAGKSPGASAVSQAYLGPLTFEWPTGCRVGVTEQVTRDGETIGLRYDLVLEQDPDGLLLEFADLIVTSMNGEPIDPLLAEMTARSMQVLPDLLIDRTGEFVEARGMERMVALMEQATGEQVTVDEEFLQLMGESTGRRYWDPWAGMWALRLEVTQVEETFVLPGVDSDSSSEEFSSTAGVRQGRAALRFVEELTGPALAAGLGSVTGMVGGVGDPDLAAELDELVDDMDGFRHTTMEAVLDPLTLRPDVVEFRQEISIQTPDESQSRVEERTWVFRWADSDCDAAPPPATGGS